MTKLRLTEWQVDRNNMFEARGRLMKVLIEHTKLGLKLSKDIADGLIKGNESSIEIEDQEKSGDLARLLTDLGVTVLIE